MVWLAIAAGIIGLFLVLLHGFARAKVMDIGTLLRWVSAIAGVVLALILVATGRGWVALLTLAMMAPLIGSRWRLWNGGLRAGAERAVVAKGGMSREEAFAVLGLAEGASREEIQAAYRHLMAAAHPDKGGSSWIAARLNQARDVLLP